MRGDGAIKARSALSAFSAVILPWLAVWLGWCCTAGAALGQSSITAENLTDEQVQKAIQAITTELYSRKDAQRFWEPAKIPSGVSKQQGGGYTALTVLALLYAGQSYQDPRLRDAVDYLASHSMEGTYAVAMRACAWAKLPPKFQDQLAADTRWLLEGFSEKTACWNYNQDPRSNYQDNSLRQFGALALWEAAKRGQKIDRRYWQRLEDALISLQHSDGGWNYKEDDPVTGSMTAAGLATLFITQDFLHAQEAVKIDAKPPGRHEKAIALGLQWMDKHFSASENPGRNRHFYYYLYGVERVGLASGYKFFGGRDWYREGAAELIHRLCAWDAGAKSFTMRSIATAPGMTEELAFALLFLSRGRVPVALNKLEFVGAWNNRPRDVANLAAWIRESSETDLNWQIVNMSGQPEAWLDAPVLYLASHLPLPWIKDSGVDVTAFVREARDFLRRRAAGAVESDTAPPAPPNIPELAKLKRYLDLGGLLFAVNEGSAKGFADSVEKAGLLMFPQFQWRALPEDHWAYTIHTPIKTRRPPLRGLSNGVRELIILSPGGDLAETFQQNDTKQTNDFHTATNIYFYASELNRPRPRLAQHSWPAATTVNRGRTAVTIARGLHEDNWKPEPQALEVFAAVLAQQRGIDVKIIDHPLATIDRITPPPALVIVSGIEEHKFTQAQTNAIKLYLASGGVILFETPGGRGGFTQSAEQMTETVFGKPIQSMLRSRIITGEGLNGAVDLTRVEYRPFALQAFGTRDTVPRLRGISLNDGSLPQILLSREDISHALLDQPRWGVSGYSPQTARDLLGNIVQHAMQLKGGTQ